MMKFLWCMVSLVAISDCSRISKEVVTKEESILEEVVEEIIQMETGKDIDLTPSTPEKREQFLCPDTVQCDKVKPA